MSPLPPSLTPQTLCVFILFLLALAPAPRSQSAAPLPPAVAAADARLGRLGSLHVRTRGIYEGVESEERLFPRLVEALHFTSREELVRNEVWLQGGDEVTRLDLEELEARLRATGLFADVSVRASEPDADGRVDLTIDTRDRLSLVFGVSGALVGNVGAVNAVVGETNLIGLGDNITVEYDENTAGEVDGAVTYTDRHLFGRWLRFTAFARKTEEGGGAGFRLYRPRHRQAEPLQWSLSASTATSDVDYFEGGDSDAQVPIDSTAVSAFIGRGFGSRAAYWQLGLDAAFDDTAYEAARGRDAATIDVPGDTTSFSLAPALRFERTARYERVSRLDTLGFTQVLALGGSARLSVGAQHRDEDRRGERVEPFASARASLAGEPFDDAFVTLESTLFGRFDAGATVASSSSVALHAYRLAPGGHTLAGSIAFDDVLEDEGLPLELTLGEDNGLRGYPSREFSGTKRVRINLEERYDPELSWRILRLGAVLFADFAWIADDDAGLGAPLRSVGLGLRIGTPELLGGGVVRIDLAFPLDEPGGENYGPLLSIALGQVFSFFGNDSVLSTR